MKPKPLITLLFILIGIYTVLPLKHRREPIKMIRVETTPYIRAGKLEHGGEIRITDDCLISGYPPFTINPIVLGSLMGAEKRTITAYSSTPDQTDDTPFITASNQRVRWGIVACNDLPFGTKVEIDGLGMFEVQDRMNSRHDNEMDIWFPDRVSALEFGKQERFVWVYGR